MRSLRKRNDSDLNNKDESSVFYKRSFKIGVKKMYPTILDLSKNHSVDY